MMCLYKAYQNIQIKPFPLAGFWCKIDLLKNSENQITVNFIFFYRLYEKNWWIFIIQYLSYDLLESTSI